MASGSTIALPREKLGLDMNLDREEEPLRAEFEKTGIDDRVGSEM